MQYVDYYKTLGVNRSATAEEITKAYKQLARKFHPDLNKEKGAEDKFKEVNEAYEVLKDADKRKRYDALGANWKHGVPFEPPPGYGGGGVHMDFGGSGFSDFFESLFGGVPGGGRRRSRGRGNGGGVNMNDLFGGATGDGQRQGQRHGQGDIESRLTISLDDVYHGAKKTIELAGGHGGNKRYEVKIPKGIRHGERIRLGGQGVPGTGGDLYIEVNIAPHEQYKVEGDDLVTPISVPAWDAALGAKVRVPTFDGDVQMTIPSGISSGQKLRLRGKGLPRRSGGHGDLFAEIRVTIPAQLSPKQRELFEKLKEVS